MMNSPLLVLCIDVDNDLWEKARIRGPVLGRGENIKAATKLAVTDPQDTDANTIFAGVKIYDEIKREGKRKVYLATVTGNKAMGHVAAREVANQLDRIVEETGVKSCILVTDGQSDEEVLPVIKSRLKIEGSKVVIIKQSKELEKTYFVILEKLKDPYYSRIIIGVPALLIFLFSLSSFFGIGWQPIGIILGLYLMAKGFGVDAFVGEVINDFRTSLTKVSWVAYLASIALIIIAVLSSYQTFIYESSRLLFPEKAYAAAIKSFIAIFPWAALVLLIGKGIDALIDNRKFKLIHYATYATGILLISMVVDVVSTWVYNEKQPFITFSQVASTVLLAVVLGILSNFAIREIKRDYLERIQIIGKKAVSETGGIVGKIIGVDMKKGTIIVQTPFERTIHINFSLVKNVEDEVVLSI
jgi:putative membrane protein